MEYNDFSLQYENWKVGIETYNVGVQYLGSYFHEEFKCLTVELSHETLPLLETIPQKIIKLSLSLIWKHNEEDKSLTFRADYTVQSWTVSNNQSRS